MNTLSFAALIQWLWVSLLVFICVGEIPQLNFCLFCVFFLLSSFLLPSVFNFAGTFYLYLPVFLSTSCPFSFSLSACFSISPSFPCASLIFSLKESYLKEAHFKQTVWCCREQIIVTVWSSWTLAIVLLLLLEQRRVGYSYETRARKGLYS